MLLMLSCKQKLQQKRCRMVSVHKPPTAADVPAADVLAPGAGIRKNAYKTPCPGCTSMIHLVLPMVHCPSCHHVYRARQLTAPTRCPRCEFNLYKWRNRIGVTQETALSALA
jgi:hypothetical protein